MAAADINSKIYNWVHTPYMEVVQLEVTNDETYKSRKFKVVFGAIATNNSDNNSQATAVAVTISGNEVTLRNADLSNSDVTLILFGRK